ncbi:hypothetical protein B0H10DRAFT_770760 [Mycena sp. CBHHK59/15]|nr:hypothetical protein B0H10DRAFT_770760 [Mycena sp. CBHHK59/15]
MRSSTPGGHDSDGSHTDASDPGIPASRPYKTSHVVARTTPPPVGASASAQRPRYLGHSAHAQPKHAQDHRELPPLETTFRAEDLPSSRGDWVGPEAGSA